MSIEEKRDEIITEYHCQDVHGELCVDCAQCRECLKEDLLELETLVRTEVIDEFVRAINSRLLRFVPTDYDDILFIAEQLKEQDND